MGGAVPGRGRASNAKVGLYGSGEALVRTSGLLNASVFGSGTVRYVGQPQDVRRQRFGARLRGVRAKLGLVFELGQVADALARLPALEVVRNRVDQLAHEARRE